MRPAPGPGGSVAARRLRLLGCASVLFLLALPACVPSAVAPRVQDRSGWLVEQISSHNASLSPQARADKYAQMGLSALWFFRATNHLYWADFSDPQRLPPYGGDAKTRIWLQGDTHVENFGAFDNNQGTVVFDLNDFDEAVIGDYQLDLWRMATSMVLLMREIGGYTAADENALLDSMTHSYLAALASYKDNDNELTRTFTASNTVSPLNDFLDNTGGRSSRVRMLDKLTSKAGGRRTLFFYNPDILPAPAPAADAIEAALPSYVTSLASRLRFHQGYFQIKGIAQRVRTGMGSMGVSRYLLLIEGQTASEDDDRLLDVKAQGEPSAWPAILPEVRAQIMKACGNSHAMRIVMAARAMGYRVDNHLGTMSLLGDPFSVREWKLVHGTFEVRSLTTLARANKLAEAWGAILATAHARADQDSSPLVPYNFEREVLGRIGPRHHQFRARVREIARAYAAQVESDYQAFRSNLMLKP